MAIPQQRPGLLHCWGPPPKNWPSDYKAMASDPARHGSPDSASRSSFSSIREQDSDLVQTFTKTSTSHLDLDSQEKAIQDPGTGASTTPGAPAMNVAQLQSLSLQYLVNTPFGDSDLVYPSKCFKGWKEIHVKGRIASKSYSDIQNLRLTGLWVHDAATTKQTGKWPIGWAPFERLPVELLSAIIDLLVRDVPPNGLAQRNKDLVTLLQVSRKMHAATLSSLYRKIIIPLSRIFQKFLSFIRKHPHLGQAVRRLDYSHFNPSHAFETAAERAQARNLTAQTLLECLDLAPGLQEFLANEYIDDDLDVAVLHKLFLGLPRLTALDFCGCSSPAFRTAISAAVTPDWPMELLIRRLSMHKCLTVSSQTLETILSRLPRLTHLDVAGTRITDSALASIPETASITHLNLAKCTLLSAGGVQDFLAHHPSVSGLVFLSLATDARSHQLLDMENVSALLPLLPRTLKSLSLKGSKMCPYHVDLMRPLTKHLEELAIGRCLGLEHVNRLFVPDDEDDVLKAAAWVPHTLKYIDLSDLWNNEIDFGYLFGRNCALLRTWSEPLEAIEVVSQVHARLTKSPVPHEKMGWSLRDIGSRYWIVRGSSDGSTRSDGRRPWKMGAEHWGMRKIPVAQADLGGMYGSYMWARNI